MATFTITDTKIGKDILYQGAQTGQDVQDL